MSQDLSASFLGDLPWLRSRLLGWFRRHGRSYPWRELSNPFHVRLAEVLLRRTKAEQVLPVYRALVERYPDAVSLASARPPEIQRLIWSLGLHRRARDLVTMAAQVRDLHGGQVPRTRAELIALPGVSDYVAGAVLSTAFHRNEWIVDTNVVRIFRRFFQLVLGAEGRRDRLIISLAREYARGRSPAKANLALIDHAALVCTSRAPRCLECPLKTRCRYFISTAALAPQGNETA